MRTVTRLSQVAAVAALGFSLAACGSSSSSGSNTASESPAASNPTASAAPTSGTDGSSATGESSATSDSGSETPDATTLVHDSRSAMKQAKSAHLAGTVVDSSGTEKIDMKGTMDGSNQEVMIDQGSKGTATVRVVAKGKNYIKGNKAYWKTTGAPAATAKVLADKWVIAPAKLAKGLDDLTISNFLTEVIGPKNLTDSDLEQAKTSKSEQDGKPTWTVSDAAKSSEDGSLVIDADSKYLLKLNINNSTDGKVDFTFDGWDNQPKLTTPPNPIDSTKLGK